MTPQLKLHPLAMCFLGLLCVPPGYAQAQATLSPGYQAQAAAPSGGAGGTAAPSGGAGVIVGEFFVPPSVPISGKRQHPLWCEGKKTTTVWFYCADALTDDPLEGCTVSLRLEKVERSGDHNHDDSNRPLGELKKTTDLKSDANGIIATEYTAPEVAGEVLVIADGTDPFGNPLPTATDLVRTMLFLDYLPVFEDSPYTLVGETETHPLNQGIDLRYGQALIELAALYSYEFPDAPPLDFNDGSLPWGGVLDICADEWRQSTKACRDGAGEIWKKPHWNHRCGVDSDIRLPPPPKVREKINWIMGEAKRRGWNKPYEHPGDHIHLGHDYSVPH